MYEENSHARTLFTSSVRSGECGCNPACLLHAFSEHVERAKYPLLHSAVLLVLHISPPTPQSWQLVY